MTRLSALYYKTYLTWRGKAGGFAKNYEDNIKKVILCNKQQFRYLLKFCNSINMNKADKLKLFKSEGLLNFRYK